MNDKDKLAYYQALNKIKLNTKQRAMIDNLVENKGYLSNSMYQEAEGVNKLTAGRHIKDMLKKNIIKKANIPGRAKYELTSLQELTKERSLER
jgi:Fic family protein